MDDTLTATEAAALKGVTRATINNAIRSGRLPATACTKEGSIQTFWSVKRSDLDVWQPLTASAAGVLSGEVRRRRRDERGTP